jgi:hypothetical protein
MPSGTQLDAGRQQTYSALYGPGNSRPLPGEALLSFRARRTGWT